LGINGAAAAADIYYVIGFVLNVRTLKKSTGISLPWNNILFKPVLGILLSLLLFKSALFLFPQFMADKEKTAFILSGILIFSVYGIFLLCSGAVDLKSLLRLKRRL
jgi:hypothetical protein